MYRINNHRSNFIALSIPCMQYIYIIFSNCIFPDSNLLKKYFTIVQRRKKFNVALLVFKIIDCKFQRNKFLIFKNI